MNCSLHSVRMGALAMILVGTLANCGGGGDGNDDGGGGPIAMRLFFGMNGHGSCRSVVVNVDLAGASAVLAHKNDDTPDCSLASSLVAAGCDVSYTELNSGQRLRATIGGCTIPETSPLFSCGFTEVDASELGAQISTQCSCTVPGCDGTPPICVDHDEEPASCEQCGNRRDDDGNGLVDCRDPNCENSPLCDATPVTSTTTTTLADEPMTIRFLLSSSGAPVGNLQLTINYASAPGRFDGLGTGVDCGSNVRGVVFSKNDRDSIRRLTLGFVSVSGIVAPQELAACRFTPDTPVPVPSNFTVVVNEAADVNDHNVNVDIDVTVSRAP